MRGRFRLPVVSKRWTYPSYWVNIDNVPNNQIFICMSDMFYATAAFKVVASGGYHVNWGDGNSNDYASAALAEHTFTKGAGKDSGRGYTTFKIVISATNAITRFYIQPNTSGRTIQYSEWLAFNFGTSGLTTLQNAFFGSAAVLWSPFLKYLKFSQNMDSCTTALYMARNSGLIRAEFPSSMALLNSLAGAFVYSPYLEEIVLPTTMSAVSNFTNFVNGCNNLQQIKNIELIPYNAVEADCNVAFFGLCYLEELTINFPLSRFHCYLNSGYMSNLRSLRLTNPNSTFTNGISIRNNALDAAALNQVFTDLPAVAGKNIDITECIGAETCDKTIATGKGWTVTG